VAHEIQQAVGLKFERVLLVAAVVIGRLISSTLLTLFSPSNHSGESFSGKYRLNRFCVFPRRHRIKKGAKLAGFAPSALFSRR